MVLDQPSVFFGNELWQAPKEYLYSLVKRRTREYDAIVVGAGPNGLSAAIALQQQGLRVLLIEAAAAIGGGLRTQELTLPGFQHDVCSAVHALAIASPFFRTLPLADFGLEYLSPELPVAHPFDNTPAAVLTSSLNETALLMGADKEIYLRLMSPVVQSWPCLVNDILAPLHWPKHFMSMARFGWPALRPALRLANRFHTAEVRALWAGMAAHAMRPLSDAATSAIAMVLMAAAHTGGWPVAKGGSQAIANALAGVFVSLGGSIQTGWQVRSLRELPGADAVLLDLGPRQLMAIAGDELSPLYRWQMRRFGYGPGVFKVDWALDGPIPFTDPACRRAGTVHLGGSAEEIASWERTNGIGHTKGRPFVLLVQQSVIDPSRAPAGKHTVWAYCHVPAGSSADMTDLIEAQVERFAPGFRDLILGRHTSNSVQMEAYNNNYVGGDINGGAMSLWQLYARPALRRSPYRTSLKGLYLCSSSTPPAGGVHGMCGYHAARQVLKDLFGIQLPFAAGSQSR